MEKKKIKRFFNLTLNACSSRFEDQGIGPILSPFMNKEKVNSFCAEFNNQSKIYKNGLPLRVQLCLFIDNSFFFFIKGANFSSLLKLALNVDKFDHNKKNEISIFDFFFLCLLKNNLFLHRNKMYNKVFFFSLINSLNSMKFLILKNETDE
jgi:ribosomal protein L11